MKKSLVITSLAFIFLLSMSVVSVSAGLWITGDIQRSQQSKVGSIPTSIAKTSDTDAFTRTATATRGTSSSSQNNQEKGPRGWAPATIADGKRCWIPPAKSKGLFGRR